MVRKLVLLAVAAMVTTTLAPTAGAAEARPAVSCGIRTFAAPADATSSPFGVTAGPGGTWYADGQTIDVISGRQTVEHYVPDPADANVGWLTRDGGQIWFADRGTGAIGTITAAGTIDEVPVPDGPNGAAVPQGFVIEHHTTVWFTDQANDRLGRYSTTTGAFTFYPVPSATPLGLVRGGDGDLYFTERSVDKVARFDPRTGLFTEWTLPSGAFPNRLAVAPDGTVWFTTLLISAVWHISAHGYLREYPVAGGPVGITYWRGHLYSALFDAGEVAQLSLHGTVERTWALPADAHPLQIAASHGAIWTSGASAVYRVAPRC